MCSVTLFFVSRASPPMPTFHSRALFIFPVLLIRFCIHTPSSIEGPRRHKKIGLCAGSVVEVPGWKPNVYATVGKAVTTRKARVCDVLTMNAVVFVSALKNCSSLPKSSKFQYPRNGILSFNWGLYRIRHIRFGRIESLMLSGLRTI